MTVDTMERQLAGHRFFADFPPGFAGSIAGCAEEAHFESGQCLAHEGERADSFFLISEGTVALDVGIPGQQPVTIATLGTGDVVGVSWLVPPYRWLFDARVIEPTRAARINAKCLRDICEADHHLGYELMKRLLPVLTQRLHATRMQLLDVYAAC